MTGRVEEAAAQGAELIITPEGALDGYVINVVNAEPDPAKHAALVKRFVSLAEPLDGPYVARAAALAKRLGVHLLLGFLQANATSGQVHNAAALFDDDGELALLYHKTHFAQGYAINPSCYAPGARFPVAATKLGTLGVMICFDRQLPETARSLRLAGAQLLLNPSYGSISAANTSADGWNTRLLRTRAYENEVPLVFTNPRQSLVLDAKGNFLAVGAANATAYAEVVVAAPPPMAMVAGDGAEAAAASSTLQHRRAPLYDALAVGADPSAAAAHAFQCRCCGSGEAAAAG